GAHQLRPRPPGLRRPRRRHPRVSFALRLSEDRLGSGARLTLPASQRVLYVREGTVGVAAPVDRLAPGSAWHGVGGVALATAGPAVMLRLARVAGGGMSA